MAKQAANKPDKLQQPTLTHRCPRCLQASTASGVCPARGCTTPVLPIADGGWDTTAPEFEAASGGDDFKAKPKTNTTAPELEAASGGDDFKAEPKKNTTEAN